MACDRAARAAATTPGAERGEEPASRRRAGISKSQNARQGLAEAVEALGSQGEGVSEEAEEVAPPNRPRNRPCIRPTDCIR